MRDSRYAKPMQDDSGFLDAMEKVREIMTGSASMMSSALGESIGGQNTKFAGIPDIKVFAKEIKDAMEQGRQFVIQARQAFPGATIAGEGAKKPAERAASVAHLKMPDPDRLAKLGLFIGGAPQTPGLTEAKRTANATEATVKKIGTLIDVTLKGITGPVYGYAE
ncbi:MAG TPA: hypothetical protein VL981_11070 [Candidatus Methylacidiphilales bacterium]|nr:hypothetical protein [Candidatus Methylacidiphilales bacterium]